MQVLGAYAYLDTKHELASVGERCRHINIDTYCIHRLCKIAGRNRIVRDNALAVPRTIKGGLCATQPLRDSEKTSAVTLGRAS